MGDRLTRLLPRVGWGAIVAAAFLVPVAYSRAVADPFSLPKATIWWMTAVLAVGGVAAWSASHRRWPIPRLRVAVPLAVLVAWTTLATILSPQPMVSLLGQYGRYDGLAALLCGAVVALAVVAFAGGTPDRLVPLVLAFVAGGAASLLVVVAQGLGWGWTGWPRQSGAADAIVGLAGNANFSGALLALVVPFVLGLRALADRRLVSIGLVIGAVALAGGVVWTGTRGGILALFAGAATFGLLAPELLPKLVRFTAVAGLIVGLVVIGASAASDPTPGPQASGAERLLARTSLGERQNVWAGAAAMIREEPLVGVGPDTFGLRFPYERPARAGHRVLVVADEAHDVYLDRAATSGLPALAAYLWLVGTMAVIAWRGRRIVAPEHRWLLAAFGGAFAGYLGQGAFSIDMVPLAWWSWVCLGAIVALTDPAVPARAVETPAPVGRPLAAPALAGLVLATLVGLGLAVRPVLADREARAGQVATRADRPLDAYAAFARASGWLDHEPRYHERQAAALVRAAAAEGVDPDLRRTLLDEAQVAYDQALDRAPDDAVLLQAQAQTHLLAAEASEDPSVAAEHVDAAIGIGRKLVRSTRATDALHLDLGRAYEARAGLASGADAQRDRDRAEEQYEAALAYVPDHVTALEGLARLAIAEDRLTDARRLLVRAQRAHHDPRVEAAIEELDRRIDAEG